jgi:hypothetical protein
VQAPESCRNDIDKQAYENAELEVCRVIDAEIVLSVDIVTYSVGVRGQEELKD